MAEKSDEVNKVTFEDEVSSDADGAKEASVENKNKHLKCPLCESTFARMPGLKRHLRKHLNEEDYKCPMCDSSFPGPKKLKNHLKTHEEDSSLVAQISELEELDSDRDTGKPAGQKSHKCPHCDAAFAAKMNLKKHMKFHTGEDFVQCTSCGAAFPDREALKVHNRTHGGHKPHKCNFCDASFGQPRGLRRHMATHGGDQCNPCGSGCGGAQQRHVTHPMDVPHYCTPCHSPFPQWDYGRMSSMANAIEKPYGCNLCGSPFAELGKLKQHVLAHSGSLMASVGEKPFKCPHCDAAFSRKAEMVAHRRSHSKGGNTEQGLGDQHTSDDQTKETEFNSEIDQGLKVLAMK